MSWRLPLRRRSRVALGVAPLALALLSLSGLAGCSSVPDAMNPVEWYRDITGVSKNDDPEGTARNSENLEAGSKEPYPNLATVPPPPQRATSRIDREALAQSLATDRANARYTDEELRATRPSLSAPPETSAGSGEAGTVAVPSVPRAPTPSTASPGGPPAAGSTAARSGPPAGSPTTVAEARAPSAARRAPPPVGIPLPPPPGAAASSVPGNAGPPVRGSEAAPKESSLAPAVGRSVPAGDTPRAAPPPPQLPPEGAAAQSGANNGVSQSTSTRTAAAMPRGMAPALPSRSTPAAAPAGMAAGGAKRAGTAAPPVTVQVAEIRFAGDATRLSAADIARLRDVARLHRENGGVVLVVGYGPPNGGKGGPADAEAMDVALDRAKAVALALAETGVPAKEVMVSTAPGEAAKGDVHRAEVYLEY